MAVNVGLDKRDELEGELWRLSWHFGHFQNADTEDLLVWAKFFQKWGKKAMDQGYVWGKSYFRLATSLVTDLSGSKPSKEAFSLMAKAMRGAQLDLSREARKPAAA